MVLLPFAALCQNPRTFDAAGKIEGVYVDRPGDFYLITVGGRLSKYNKEGALLATQENSRSLTVFDPRDGARLFAYRAGQFTFRWLTPSLELRSTEAIDSSFAIQPQLACPAGAQDLVLFDSADMSLRKINLRTNSVLFDVQLAHTGYTTMREYQNFIFLLDPAHGIDIYNSVGVLVRSIDVPGLRQFNFLGEELYYQQNGVLQFFDLFTTETRTLPLPATADWVIITDEYLMLAQAKKISIYPARR